MKRDVVIVGAGPAGLSFARALAAQKIGSVVIEKQPMEAISEPQIDGRDIALTHLSQNILQELGIWKLMPDAEIGRIREARVLNGSSDYFLHFDSQDTSREELGYIVSNHVIRKAVFDAVADNPLVEIKTGVEVSDVGLHDDARTVQLSDGTSLRAPLVVAADSRFSTLRRNAGIAADMHDFGKMVLVGRMEVEHDHRNIAYECFHYDSTLAVLPLPDKLVSIVITADTEDALKLMKLDPASFDERVQQRFENRLGNMSLVDKCVPYPLVAVLANRFIAPRFALLGDAAVGMHPVTAHGFNLGLQGARTLAKGIARATLVGQDIGANFVLKNYQRRHRFSSLPIYHGTNEVVRLFNSDSPKARIARQAVLRIGNNLPPLKKMIMNRLTEIPGDRKLKLPGTGLLP